MASAERVEKRGTRTRNGDCDFVFFERFHLLLQETVPQYCAANGIAFDKLPGVEQQRLTYEVLQLLERKEWWIYSQQRQQASMEFRPHDEITVNLRKVEIKISEREEPVILVPPTERMLAYFIALTEAKIYRWQEPLITADQLTRVVDTYKLDQLRDHLLNPLAESGILMVDPSKRGYRLSVDPEALWEILQGKEFSYEIEAEGYESWLGRRYPGAVLVGSHLEKMLKAIQLQVDASFSDNDLFDLERIETRTGLGRDRVYENLQELERLGIICRRRAGDQYRMADIVDKRYLKEIVRRQETSINIKVNPSDSFSEILTVDRQEKFSFPQVSWVEGKGFEALSREQKLLLLFKIFTAHLKAEVNETAGKKFAIKIPEIENEPRELILDALQYLGIGPKELGILSPVRTETLAAAIRRLEERVNSQSLAPNYGSLMEQIRVNLLKLVFEQEVAGKDSHGWTFPEVLKFFYDSPLLNKEAA